MSPQRYIPTVNGVHGGALVIVGLWYIAQGLAWSLSASRGLEAGVAWIPHGWVTQDSVGWGWTTVGAAVLLCGMFSKAHQWRENVGYVLAVFYPSLILLWFLIALYLGRPVTGAIGIVMMAGPLAFVAWVGLRVKDPQALREVAS